MTGYKPKRTLYRLTFEDPDLEGLEVVCKGVSVEGLLEITALGETIEALGDEMPDPASLRKMFAPFARVLQSWNVVDDDDQPVAANLAGLLAQEMDFVNEVITGYARAMTQAPPPLPGSSASGGSSPEPSTTALAAASSPPASS
jgi:hypothetical protein